MPRSAPRRPRHAGTHKCHPDLATIPPRSRFLYIRLRLRPHHLREDLSLPLHLVSPHASRPRPPLPPPSLQFVSLSAFILFSLPPPTLSSVTLSPHLTSTFLQFYLPAFIPFSLTSTTLSSVTLSPRLTFTPLQFYLPAFIPFSPLFSTPILS